MFDLSGWSLAANSGVLLAATVVIALAGVRLARLADRLADRTGMGEAMTGAILLGMTTSLAGIMASVSAAIDGRPALAISNAMGGIAVQTVFLAVADIAYKRANLEHAAASLPNMIQNALLLALLSLVMMGLAGPEITVGHTHPMTYMLFLAWGGGMWLAYRSRKEPMWRPQATRETVEDIPAETPPSETLRRLVVEFAINGALVAFSGALVGHTAGNIAELTVLNKTMAGALLSAVTTSLPELVTVVAAVRRGALTLAVSDIVGGNAFDILFVCAADVFYLQGSLFHGAGVGPREMFLTALTITLNVVLLLGLLYRQRQGPGKIGFESVLIIGLYGAGLLILSISM